MLTVRGMVIGIFVGGALGLFAIGFWMAALEPWAAAILFGCSTWAAVLAIIAGGRYADQRSS